MPTRIAGLLTACAACACASAPAPRPPPPNIPKLTIASIGESHSWDSCPDGPPDRLTELALAFAVVTDVASPSSRLWPRYEPPATISVIFDSDGLGALAGAPPAYLRVTIQATTLCGAVSLHGDQRGVSFIVTIRDGRLEFRKTTSSISLYTGDRP